MADSIEPNLTTNHFWLYVLKLEDEKFYVGITTKTPEIRFQQHLNGIGANWTRAHKPLKIIQRKDLGVVSETRATSFENKVTRKYIRKYGLNNIRGGDVTDTEELVSRFGQLYPKDIWNYASITILILAIMIISALYALTKH